MAIQTTFSSGFLVKVKAMLEEQEATLEREVAQLAVSKDRGTNEQPTFPDFGSDEGDNAQEVAEYAANLTIEQDLARSLRDVKQALGRLNKNEYGICKYCKKPIEEKRLLARPTSSACVECKKTIIQEV